jgi:ABC-type transport system substrate-binding protein
MTMDPFLDKDLEDGRFKADMAARRAAYLDAQRILRAAQPAAWLFNPAAPELVAARVHGFQVPPATASGQRYVYVTEWYLNTKRVGKK